MAKNNAWSKIKSEKTEDKARYRDVYNRQQLERGQIEEKTTMTGRSIIAAVVALIIFAAAYYVTSIANLTIGIDNGVMSPQILPDYRRKDM